MNANTTAAARERIERAVLAYVSDPSYRPARVGEIVRRVDPDAGQHATLRRVVRAMVRDGRLASIPGRRVVAGGPDGSVVGIVERRRDGRLVLTPANGSAPIEIPERHVGGARDGDTVAVRATEPAGERSRARGVVVRIIARERGRRLGVVGRRGRAWEVRPLEPDAPAKRLPPAFRHDAVLNDVVRYVDASGRRSSGECRVVEVLGPVDAPGVDVEVVCRRHGLRPEFPSEVDTEARSLPTAVPEEEARRRERFDDPAPVTIDGESAKDFDDAIAVQKMRGGGWRLYVHVADVAWFVRTGSALDLEAAARGTSTYFPDTVVPMLPHRLSDDLCSLRPDEDRLVRTVIIDLDRTGKVFRQRIARGVIRSAARLTYDQVASALDGRTRAHGIADAVLSMLIEADRLRRVLQQRREDRGSIDFDLPEPRIQVDLEGVMTGVAIRPRNDAHRMIEAFMLLANEVVAESLTARGGPCLYRVHEVPDPTKVESLREFVAKFGVSWDAEPFDVRPGDVRRLLQAFEGRAEYPIVAQVALRSMKQARYSVENGGHFGLAAGAYVHFTSPIRRYPDLVVHRLVAAEELGGDGRVTVDPLEQVAAASSRLERNAEAAERELLEWKKIAFMRRHVGDDLDGIVTGVASFGLFVRLTESLVEGLVRVESLGHDWYEFDPMRFELVGRASGETFSLGDRVRVCVDRVDVALRRVELSLHGRDEGGPSRRRRTRRPSRRGRRRPSLAG